MLHCPSMIKTMIFNLNLKKLLMLTLFMALFLGRSTAVQAQDPAQEMFSLINQFRVEIGLPAFAWNGTLAIAAQQQANFIAQTGNYTHTGVNGSSPQKRATALGYSGYVVENIVGGGNMSPQRGLIWWQNSPVHYNTLVSTRHIEAGVGYVGGGQNRFALVVGRPSNAPVQAASSAASSQAAPLVVAPLALNEPDEDGRITHIVGQGHALWTLAAYYEVPLSDILRFNDLSENALVRPGDEIIIQLGASDSLPPTPTPAFSHIVQEGQTLWAVAAIHDISLADVLTYNSLPEDALIQPGDELRVRLREGELPPPTATPQLRYTVQAGDSFLAIAGRFGLTLNELLTLNGVSESELLQPGDELLIRVPDPVLPTPAPVVVTPTPPILTVTATIALVAIAQVTETAEPTVGLPDEATPLPSTPVPVASETAVPLSGGWLIAGGGGILLVLGVAFLFANRRL